MFKFSTQYINKIIAGIYAGTIAVNELPESLYLKIAEFLKEGMYHGFGTNLNKLTRDINKGVADWTSKDLELLTELRDNVYIFSAAKTYQQVREMTDSLTDDQGNIVSLPKFKEAASVIFNKYNTDWLAAEYDTAIGQAQNAVNWNRIIEQKKVLPLLKYSAVEDGNLCEICAPLDNMVAPVDDEVWSDMYPENHFRCRCLVQQISDEEGNAMSRTQLDEITSSSRSKMAPEFLMNAGKDQVIYSPKHPYFSVAPRDRSLAKRNFGLKIPKSD